MATLATAVWRIRVAGDDANGAGYDAGISGAGTDYTQQDSPQATITNLACAQNATSVTSASNPFTAAMVGNAIKISSGTNAVTGYYWITAYVSASQVTVDRTPATAGAMSGGGGRVGGAALNLGSVLSSGPVNYPVGGNTVYMRGSGSDSPTSADYLIGGNNYLPSGGSTGVLVKIRGENGRPRLEGSGSASVSGTYYDIQGLMFVSGGAGNLLFLNNSVARGNVFNSNGYDCQLIYADTCIITDNEFFAPLGSTAATSGNAALSARRSVLAYNHLHDLSTISMQLDAGYNGACTNNIVANGLLDGVLIVNDTYGFLTVMNNTITGNGGHGINVAATNGGIANIWIGGNLIANHVGSGKAGIAVAGIQATNDASAFFLAANAFYNNASHVSGLTSIGTGSAVLGSNPFTSASTEDFTPVSGVTMTLPSQAFMQHIAAKKVGMVPGAGAPGAVGPAAGSGLNVTRAEIYHVA